MPFLGDTISAGASGAGYTIDNAVMLDGSADYFTRTFTTSSTTSGSLWIKRCKFASTTPLFDNKVYFNSSDQLVAFGLTSTAVFRDPTAWMHIFWNGSGVWVNGVSISGTGSYSQSATTNPRLGYNGTNFASIYVSDFALWDGSSVSLTGGTTDSITGSWKATSPSGSKYSFLDFANTADLGNDVSGNNNDWTPTSITSANAVTDTPTNNFNTLNPLNKFSTITLSNGNINVSTSTPDAVARGTIAVSSGKFVYEYTVTAIGASIGFCLASAAINSSPNAVGFAAWVGTDIYVDATIVASTTAPAVSEVVRVELDLVNNTIAWYRDGTLVTQQAWTPSGPVHVFWRRYTLSPSGTFNFGARAWTGSPSTGFDAICTDKLDVTTGVTSGSFTGNASSDGPCVWTGAPPDTLTIDGNAVTWGTHADKTAGGFKIRTASSPYNDAATNNWTATYETPQKPFVGSNKVPGKAQGNP